MKIHEERIERAAARLGGLRPEYFRLWDPGTAPPHRRLHCFKYPGKRGRQEEISEAEYLAATGSTLTNAEAEAFAGQKEDNLNHRYEEIHSNGRQT